MRQWKAAGPAPKGVDDELWKRFRGAQDTFFGARDAANAALDAEFAANAEVKEKLIVEAEALLPVTDLATAKTAFRDLADRWDDAGKVPRDRIKELEGRMRAVEQAIRKVEDEQWQRSDPEKSARADDMVAKLEAAIADAEAKLEKARAAGDDKRIRSSRRTSRVAGRSSRWPGRHLPTTAEHRNPRFTGDSLTSWPVQCPRTTSSPLPVRGASRDVVTRASRGHRIDEMAQARGESRAVV